MTQPRPLTSQEIDDGWCLDEAPLDLDDEPYLELVIIEERPPASALEEAFWEQREGKKLRHRFGEGFQFFSAGPRARGTRPPPKYGD